MTVMWSSFNKCRNSNVVKLSKPATPFATNSMTDQLLSKPCAQKGRYRSRDTSGPIRCAESLSEPHTKSSDEAANKSWNEIFLHFPSSRMGEYPEAATDRYRLSPACKQLDSGEGEKYSQTCVDPSASTVVGRDNTLGGESDGICNMTNN